MNDITMANDKSKAPANRILLVHIKHNQNRDIFQRLVQLSQVLPEIVECIQNEQNLTQQDLKVRFTKYLTKGLRSVVKKT